MRQRVRAAAELANRDASAVTIVAVSKQHPVAAMEAAYRAGQRDFGENYLQEALEKKQALAHLSDIEWHFIGPIQSNKTRAIAENFDWLHSIDRLKTAQRLSAQRPSTLPALQACVQVNIDDEETKAGVSLAELPSLVEQVNDLPNLCLRGLMSIPAPCHVFSQQCATFARLREVMTSLRHAGLTQLDTLSIGMSGDLEAAIASGATVVRVGTDIFGARAPKG